MDKILVMGSGGFVGTNLVNFLVGLSRVKEIFLVDKKLTPKGILKKFENSNMKVQSISSDRIPCDVKYDEVDVVICLAGATSVDAALDEPYYALEENFKIAITVAEWIRCRNPNGRLLYISSDEVLGESKKSLPEDSIYAPTQPYAVSKAAAEIILKNYRDVYDLDIIILRACNLVGAGQKEPKLIPTAVKCLLKGTSVPIHGNGNQLREWMAVEDFCNAIIRLLEKEVPSSIFQASSGIKFSVNEVVNFVAEALNYPLLKHKVQDRLIQDNSYAMQSDQLRALGWEVTIDPKFAIKKAAIEISNEFKLN